MNKMELDFILDEAIVDIFHDSVDDLIHRIINRLKPKKVGSKYDITELVLNAAYKTKPEDYEFQKNYKGRIVVEKVKNQTVLGNASNKRLDINQNIDIKIDETLPEEVIRHEIEHTIVKIRALVLRKTEKRIMHNFNEKDHTSYALSEYEVEQAISRFVSYYRKHTDIAYKNYNDMIKDIFYGYVPSNDSKRKNFFDTILSKKWKEKIFKRLARERVKLMKIVNKNRYDETGGHWTLVKEE